MPLNFGSIVELVWVQKGFTDAQVKLFDQVLTNMILLGKQTVKIQSIKPVFLFIPWHK